MEVKFLNQPKEVKLGDILNQRLKENFDEVYVIAGFAKDDGVEVIQDSIEEATKSGTKVNVFIGIDRKNTSKDMLLKLLSEGCNLSVHINTDDSKVEMKVYVFGRKDGDSYIYVTGAKLSNGGLLTNTSTITEIKYGSDDKKLFDISKNNILAGATTEFHNIDEEEVILLAEKGDIVARIIDRKIPKISEMYGNKENVIVGEQIYDESTSNSILSSDDFEDMNIDIDIDSEIGMRKNVVLETERELKKEKNEKDEMLKRLSKTEKDLDRLYGKKEEKEEDKKKPIILMSDEVDYSSANTFMIEANKIAEKGPYAGLIRIPKSVADKLNVFFDEDKNFKMMDDEYLGANVEFDVIDNKENKTRKDGKVAIRATADGITIKSDEMLAMNLQEGDIIRLIKESNKLYRCEIIRKDTDEYNIWSGYLIHSIRGQKRRYGIM